MANAQTTFPLTISEADVAIDQSIEGGFLLRIRARPGIRSILLTESTQDPTFRSAAYAFRAKEYNPINGQERRVLDGQFIDSPTARYFLLDSSPYPDEQFGSAFHIFIPYVVVYGYPWTRNGERFIHDGAFINIRAFELPYADYSGAFADNSYIIRVIQQAAQRPPTIPPTPTPPTPTPPSPTDLAPAPLTPTDLAPAPLAPADLTYSSLARDSFANIARDTDGEALVSSGSQDLIDTIANTLDTHQGAPALDVVFALDTTNSMRDDIETLQQQLTMVLQQTAARHPELRVGIILYRDYGDEYLTHTIAFDQNLTNISARIANITVDGGRDNPEAVYEALYAALQQFDWQAPARQIVLIGDAPPHPLPRRDGVSRAIVTQTADEMGIPIHTILLPK